MVSTYYSCLTLGQLEGIAKVLGDTSNGLSGSEIGHLLDNSKIPDIDPTNTKWKRLYNAFIHFQNEQHVGNNVLGFIWRAMAISRYTNNRELFKSRQEQLNRVLATCGYELGDDGEIHTVEKAKKLDEAIDRANRLRSELEHRKVHSDILKYCHAELIKDNYFHAVLEAVKSITAKVRKLANLTEDGSALVDRAFGGSVPQLIINSYNTDTLKGEQRGFVSLLKGLYGTIRNPLAHEPKIEWQMSEQDALDIFCLISLIHRKLDNVKNG